MCHEIATCISCLSARSVFHSTKCIKNIGAGQPSPIVAEKWKIFKDGRCKRCHQERLRNKRENNGKAATFSGIFSLEDSAPISNLIRHNDMHFRNIPPHLKGLTSTEMALISKICVITNIHVLKTGMYAGRGHSISLPQPMNIATQLPLLPEDINIVVLKRTGASGKLRHYSVKRSSVQEALEGLCYGFPNGGIDSPNDLCQELYTGADHRHMFQILIIMMWKSCLRGL